MGRETCGRQAEREMLPDPALPIDVIWPQATPQPPPHTADQLGRPTVQAVGSVLKYLDMAMESEQTLRIQLFSVLAEALEIKFP